MGVVYYQLEQLIWLGCSTKAPGLILRMPMWPTTGRALSPAGLINSNPLTPIYSSRPLTNYRAL
jgi:hypothetical protein